MTAAVPGRADAVLQPRYIVGQGDADTGGLAGQGGGIAVAPRAQAEAPLHRDVGGSHHGGKDQDYRRRLYGGWRPRRQCGQSFRSDCRSRARYAGLGRPFAGTAQATAQLCIDIHAGPLIDGVIGDGWFQYGLVGRCREHGQPDGDDGRTSPRTGLAGHLRSPQGLVRIRGAPRTRCEGKRPATGLVSDRARVARSAAAGRVTAPYRVGK